MTEPEQPRTPLQRAIALHQQGALAEAETHYRAILAENPAHPDALHLLGVLSHQQGCSAAAEQLIRQSLALAPEQAGAHNNLGNVYSAQKRFDEAAASYRRAVELAPAYAGGHVNLGHALLELGRVAQARAAYEQAAALAPDDPAPWLALAGLHESACGWDEAVENYRQVLARDPASIPALQRSGALLRKLGRLDEALAVYDQWLGVVPFDPVARHLRAACTQTAGPARASDDYVRATFDGIADAFDASLSDLGYRAPELVAEALGRHRARLPGRDLDVLDAGCGTGLCGARGLTAAARRLVGVDLSARMLAKAQARGGYHELVQAELGAYIEQSADAFDLIVCADTFIYFGDLRPVLVAAARRLRRPGLLVFTVERLAPDGAAGDGYRLGPYGRYQHGESYLRQSLDAAGFELLDVQEPFLRREGGAPVIGLLLVAAVRGGARVCRDGAC